MTREPTARELLRAAERSGAEKERVACAAAVCDLCATGDVPIFDPVAGRERAVAAERKSIRTAFAFERLDAGRAMLAGDPGGERRADVHKEAHRRRCLVCRAGSEALCRSLGAAAAVDRFLDHRRTCRGACRTPKGEKPIVCREGARLRDAMRREACAGGWDRSEDEALARAAAGLYPDEFFHVLGDGSSERCAATAILLRGPRPQAPRFPADWDRQADAIEARLGSGRISP